MVCGLLLYNVVFSFASLDTLATGDFFMWFVLSQLTPEVPENLQNLQIQVPPVFYKLMVLVLLLGIGMLLFERLVDWFLWWIRNKFF